MHNSRLPRKMAERRPRSKTCRNEADFCLTQGDDCTRSPRAPIPAAGAGIMLPVGPCGDRILCQMGARGDSHRVLKAFHLGEKQKADLEALTASFSPDIARALAINHSLAKAVGRASAAVLQRALSGGSGSHLMLSALLEGCTNAESCKAFDDCRLPIDTLVSVPGIDFPTSLLSACLALGSYDNADVVLSCGGGAVYGVFDLDGANVFHNLASRGECTALQWLLAKTATAERRNALSSPDFHGRTPLFAALTCGVCTGESCAGSIVPQPRQQETAVEQGSAISISRCIALLLNSQAPLCTAEVITAAAGSLSPCFLRCGRITIDSAGHAATASSPSYLESVARSIHTLGLGSRADSRFQAAVEEIRTSEAGAGVCQAVTVTMKTAAKTAGVGYARFSHESVLSLASSRSVAPHVESPAAFRVCTLPSGGGGTDTPPAVRAMTASLRSVAIASECGLPQLKPSPPNGTAATIDSECFEFSRQGVPLEPPPSFLQHSALPPFLEVPATSEATSESTRPACSPPAVELSRQSSARARPVARQRASARGELRTTHRPSTLHRGTQSFIDDGLQVSTRSGAESPAQLCMAAVACSSTTNAGAVSAVGARGGNVGSSGARSLLWPPGTACSDAAVMLPRSKSRWSTSPYAASAAAPEAAAGARWRCVPLIAAPAAAAAAAAGDGDLDREATVHCSSTVSALSMESAGDGAAHLDDLGEGWIFCDDDAGGGAAMGFYRAR